MRLELNGRLTWMTWYTERKDGSEDPDRCRVHSDEFASQLTPSNCVTCRHALASLNTTWRTRVALTNWKKTKDATRHH